MLALAAICGAEMYYGEIKTVHDGLMVADNSWSFDSDSGVLTVKSNNNLTYNESGRTGAEADGSWYEHKTGIKKVELVGNFSKITYGAFMGCTSLEEINLTEDVTIIDNDAFSGCSSLSKITLDHHQPLDFTADLRNVSVLGGKEIFKGTMIKEFYIGSSITEDEIKDLNVFPEGIEKLYGIAGSYIETYAKENNIAFAEIPADPVVTVLKNGKTQGTYEAPYGRVFDSYKNPTGAIDLLFTDEQCTTLYDNSLYTLSNTTLYAQELMTCIGFSLRTREYSGLRTLYELYDSNISNAEITEVGVLGGYGEYALNDVTADSTGIGSIVIYQNGILTGKLVSEKNGKKTFAATAVGFEKDDGTLDTEKANKGIIYRGYIKVKNLDNGNEEIYYTDSAVMSLRSLSERFLSSYAAAACTNTEKAFIGNACASPLPEADAVRYNKTQLSELLSEAYNSSEMLLIGEQIEYNQYPSDRLASFSDKGVELPSILGVDVSGYGMKLKSMNDARYQKYLTELIDYAHDGGIITVCSHIDCPNGSVGASGEGFRGKLVSEQEWRDLVSEGTVLNTELKELLNIDARLLRDLKNNGIPVLFRPFHEMNGSWFWWNVGIGGAKVDAELFKDLWIYVHNYYTKELGLTNLIWVYSPNFGNIDVDYCYPGNEYVDITGLDWYAKSADEISQSRQNSDTVDYKVMMAQGKPVALTEFGFSGTYKPSAAECSEIFKEMMQNNLKSTYVLGWNNVFTGREDLTALMQSDFVISLADMRQLFN